MHIVEIFLCYGLYSALCVCVCGEIGVIVILLYLERTSKKTGLPPKAMSVSVIVGVYLVCAMYVRLCVRVRLFFPNIHPELLGLRGEFQSPDEL